MCDVAKQSHFISVVLGSVYCYSTHETERPICFCSNDTVVVPMNGTRCTGKLSCPAYLFFLLACPAGIAMPPAGLCSAEDFLFFNCRPSHSTTGARISTRIVAFTPSMKKIPWLKIWGTLVKGRCYSNHFCAVKWRQVGMKRLHCLCWHCTMVGNIAKTIPIQNFRDPGCIFYVF